MKVRVRCALPAHFDELRVRITGAVAEVTPDKLRQTWEEIHHMWDICRATSGNRTVTLIHETKLDAVGYISTYFVFIYHLLINVYILSKL
jgi:hypothetical protein